MTTKLLHSVPRRCKNKPKKNIAPISIKHQFDFMDQLNVLDFCENISWDKNRSDQGMKKKQTFY